MKKRFPLEKKLVVVVEAKFRYLRRGRANRANLV